MLPIMLAIFLVNLGAISSSSSPPVVFSGATANPHSALMHKSIYSCGDDYDCWRRPLGYSSTCVNHYCICSFGYANNMTNERCTRIECTNHFQCSAHFDYSQCVDFSCVCYGNYTLNTSTVECEPTGGLPLGAILGIVGGVIVFFILIVVLVVVLRRQKKAKPGRPIQTQAPHHPSVGMVAFVPGTAHPQQQQQFPLQPVGEQARQPAFNAAYPQANYYPQQPAPFVYSHGQGPYQGPPPLPQAPPEYSPPYSQPEDGFQKAHYHQPSTSNDTPTAPKI